jgi:hypothetical protein
LAAQVHDSVFFALYDGVLIEDVTMAIPKEPKFFSFLGMVPESDNGVKKAPSISGRRFLNSLYSILSIVTSG